MNATVSELILDAAGTPVALNEVFDPDSTSCTASVAHDANVVTVSAMKADEQAYVALPVDDTPSTTGHQVKLEVRNSRLVVTVAAENSSKKRYIVTVRTWGEIGLGEEAGAASDLIDLLARAWRVRAGGPAVKSRAAMPTPDHAGRRSALRSRLAARVSRPRLRASIPLVEDVSYDQHVTA